MRKFLKQMFFSLGVMLIFFTGCKHNPGESVTLTGITLDTTNVKKEFTVDDTFTTEGLVVTASYSDETTKDVTDWTASGDDLSKASESQTIKISYTEDDVTQTAEYTIVIKDKTEGGNPGDNPPKEDPPQEEPPVKIEYQITYETQFGSVPSKKVEQGYKLTAADLPSLTQTGYVFEGWDKSVGYEITADTKITASWKKIDSAFAISLDSGSELKFNVTVNDKNLIFNVPTGYKTYEWYVDGNLDKDTTGNTKTIITDAPNPARAEQLYQYSNGKHEILVVVTAADGSKDSARATFVIYNNEN